MMEHTVYSLQKTGSAHRFCQDRHGWLRLEDRLLLVAADGHGNSAYVRSGLGARFACAAALAELRAQPEELAAAIKDRYDRMVAKHLAHRPLSAWEQEKAGALSDREVYGATLLAAVLTHTDTLLLQLGDGEIHALREDGTLLPELPADNACVGSMTTSLGNSRNVALQHFRMAVYPEPAAAVVLMTDGCDGGAESALQALAEPSGPIAAMAAMLEKTDRGDDQTVVTAYDLLMVARRSFREQLERELEQRREEARCRRQRLRDMQELEQLDDFLKRAARKVKYLEQTQPSEIAPFLLTVSPSVDRYLQLKALLNG